MKRLFCSFLASLFLITPLFCDENMQTEEKKQETEKKQEEEQHPLFAGTLLSFYAVNADPGRLSFQPFFFLTRQNGEYNPHSELISDRNVHSQNFILSLETGITKTIDITLIMNAVHSQATPGDTVNYGDTFVFLGFFTSKNKKNTIIPDSRMLLGVGFPTGRFDNLDPNGSAFESTGSGAYEFYLGYALRKIFFNIKDHPWCCTLNAFYIPSSNVVVRGLNIYGGTPNSRGRITPGDFFIGNVAFEYLFTKNWGCGIDFHYITQASSSFASEVPFDPFHGLPSSELFSIAPCLEYNFNEDFSIEWGAWFTVKGRNAFSFESLGATLYYYF